MKEKEKGGYNNMAKAEQQELYNYTKDQFAEKLSRISPNCVSPIIVVRQTVKSAINKYIIDYCTMDTKAEDIFSQEDFQEVSNRLYQEIMEGEL